MNPLTSRRSFLFNTGKAGLGIWIGSTFLSSCAATNRVPEAPWRSGFTQDPLPYKYSDLSEAIDAQTMEIHHTKHALGYSSNLQEAVAAENVGTNTALEDILRNVSKYSTKMRNNGGGHYNHELFWKCMSPQGGGAPTGRLAEAINRSFGSFDAFKTQFSTAARDRFGSGWAWLAMDGDRNLRIGSTPNQDNPLMNVSDFRGLPIMGLDVWEHAYYLRYQNKRPDYINNWWKVVNWNFIGTRYESVAP